MKYSALVGRISGDGADAWDTHIEARLGLERGEDVILLSVGDPDLDTPAAVTERAIEQLRRGDTHYTPPEGREALREAIANGHQARTGQSVTADQVIFLSGAQNALFTASMCLLGNGDEVIALEPLYPTYPATLEVSGARLVRVRTPASRDFHVDLAALESAISERTRAIFFATPNNPSGAILSAAELAGIARLARQHSLWIVSDEVYAGLAPGGKVPSLAAQLPDQVVTISSLSKTHAMPGWRAGWMVGPRQFVQHAESLVMCMLFGLPGFIQEAAITALAIAGESETKVRDYCAIRCKLLQHELRGIEAIRCCVPEAGMFMLIDVRGTGLTGRQFMHELYRSEKVSVLDGGAFGEETAGFVRVFFATDEGVLREACARIRRFIAARAAASSVHGVSAARILQ
jgi:arginine:pyruvate transaminase